MKSHLKGASKIVLGLLLASAGAAHAQTGRPAADASVVLEDVIVTAQRRSERLQDVPVAITALDAQRLENARVQNVEMIGLVTPSLSMTKALGVLQPYIRGVGTQNIAPGEEGSVSMYVDGVYIGAVGGTSFSLPDVERVEILKGPQGTLFGRNATGGLIQIITREPSDHAEGSLNLEGSSYETVTVKGFGAAPLADGLSASLAFSYSNQGKGWGDNLTTGGKANRGRDAMVRGKLVWAPGDGTRVILAGDIQHARSDFGLSRRLFLGQVASTGFLSTGGLYDTRNQAMPLAEYAQKGASLRAQHDFGGLSLESTTAYRHYKDVLPTDNDHGPAPLLSSIQSRFTKTFQQEVLARGDAGALSFTGGAFFYHAYAKYDPLAIRSMLLPSQNRNLFAHQETNSLSGFLDLTWRFDPNNSLTVGGRYTRDEKTFEGGYVSAAGYVGPAQAPPITGKSTFKKPTWRVVFEHRFDPDIMGYASVSRGFKAGGYNVAFPPNPPVESETITAYEVGLKSELFNRSLRLNLSAFRYEYKNIQLQLVPTPGTTLLLNAAGARVSGADFEARTAFSVGEGRLTLDANGAYVRSHYTKFPLAPFYYPQPAVCNAVGTANPGTTTGPLTGGVLICNGDAAGHRLMRAPKYSGSATASYTVPVGGGDFGLSTTLAYNGGFYFDPDNRFKQTSYTLLNANVSYTVGRYRLYAYGANITGKHYLNQASTSSFGTFVTYGAPEIYGAGVTVKF